MADTAAAERRRRLPAPWLGNLLVFSLLFAMVLGWFYFQTRQAEQAFLTDAGEHAGLLADAVGLHVRGAVLAEHLSDAILGGFLRSSARFVDYLDGIEPFRAEELSAFAGETGLSVVGVVGATEVTRGGLAGAPPAPDRCEGLDRLNRTRAAHTVLYGIARGDTAGCIWVGMDSRRIDDLQAEIELGRALETVRRLPGIVNVSLQGTPERETQPGTRSQPRVGIEIGADGRVLARAQTPVAGALLTVDMDAGPLLAARERLWLEFAGFACALALTGGLGTWLLYRHQRAHDRQLRGFEQRLSRRREEAGLGRAAAAIAHEIRNPLNAMAMGLQRLQMEADELDAEHRHLLQVVLDAVRRTNGTVSGLLDYARPLQPKREVVHMEQLLRDQLSLYSRRLAQNGAQLELRITAVAPVRADADLLRQVLDNLLRNALEAVPAQGDVEIVLEPAGTDLSLTISNDGFALAADQAEGILEPWFTTKTQGTGLGLAISRRIVAAHGGTLGVEVPRPGRLQVCIRLPGRRHEFITEKT